MSLPPRSVRAPRKIPRQARAAATVAAIVEAAARILEQQGLGGYTTNAIAARAGISIGSLYQYFPDRDAITKALIERQTGALVDEAREAMSAATGKEGLDRLVVVAVQHQLSRPALARLLDFEEDRLPLADDMRDVGEKLADVVIHCLDRSDLAGVTTPPDAAHDLLAIIKGMVDSAGKRHETDTDLVVRRTRHAVFGYLTYHWPSA